MSNKRNKIKHNTIKRLFWCVTQQSKEMQIRKFPSNKSTQYLVYTMFGKDNHQLNCEYPWKQILSIFGTYDIRNACIQVHSACGVDICFLVIKMVPTLRPENAIYKILLNFYDSQFLVWFLIQSFHIINRYRHMDFKQKWVWICIHYLTILYILTTRDLSQKQIS